MSAPAPQQQDPQTVTGVAGKVGTALISALPAPFLALCSLNLVFVLAIVWYFDHLRADRVAMFHRLMDACMAQIETGKAKPPAYHYGPVPSP